MRDNVYHRKIIERFNFDSNKSIVFQNFRHFLFPSFFVEQYDSSNKAFLYGMKKKRYAKSKSRNFEKVALLVKHIFPLFFYVFCVFCFVYALLFPHIPLLLVSNLLIILFIVFFVCILHEFMHIVVFKKLNIPYTVEYKPSRYLPLVVQLKSDYFRGNFLHFERDKKFKYIMIVVAPYLLIFPLCLLLITLNFFVLSVCSFAILISHIINLPFEFMTENGGE